jgi:uncharacterized protein YndB with AHSA1/START domain
MAIHFEHTLHVARPPASVFALLDDLSQTPRWLSRCTGIEKLDTGDNRVGMRLRYAYKEAGRAGTMEGEITARKPDERLTYQYRDRMMEVVVDFKMAAGADGTQLTHAIDITPRTFLAKLMAPLIRRQLPKQTVTAMTTLKGLVEAV